MKVRSIEYSRLYNLRDYNNERISLVADIEDNEKLGEAYFKLVKIVQGLHYALSLHREIIYAKKWALEELDEYHNKLKDATHRLDELKKKKAEFDCKIEQLKAGEIDATKVTESDFCILQDLAKQIEWKENDIENYNAQITKLHKRIEIINKLLEIVEKDIQQMNVQKYIGIILRVTRDVDVNLERIQELVQ